jgi:hypothetical protein
MLDACDKIAVNVDTLHSSMLLNNENITLIMQAIEDLGQEQAQEDGMRELDSPSAAGENRRSGGGLETFLKDIARSHG